MGKSPKVSIIIPVYNAENTLKRCVDSVLSQTFSDFELILIDDGSKDASPSIIDDYAQQDSRIVPIHKTNGGVSSARNAGLDVASGEYVTFIDSDDYVTTTFLEDMIVSNDDIVICGIFYVINFGENKQTKIENLKSIRYTYENTAMFLKEYGDNIIVRTPWAKLFKKNIIDEYNIRFNSRMRYGEDTLFNLEVFMRSKCICLCPQPEYYYIVSPPTGKYLMDISSYKYSVTQFREVANNIPLNDVAQHQVLNFDKNIYKTYYRYVENLPISKRAYNIIAYILTGLIKFNPRRTRFATLKTLFEIVKLIIPGRRAALKSF